MKIGVLADSHNKLEITCQAIERLRTQGAVALFHCGDLMNEAIVKACAEIQPAYIVAGNNDPSLKQLELWSHTHGVNFLGRGGVVALGRHRIGLTHGHEKTTVAKILKENPDYLLVGHSHFRRDERIGTVRIINPGALHRSSSKSCVLIDLDTDRVETILMESM